VRRIALLAWLAASPAVGQDTHLIVVVGLGGSAEHRETFLGQAVALVRSAEQQLGLAPARVTLLAEKVESATGVVDGRSTREAVEAAIHDVGDAARPGDLVVLVLIGHGSYRSGEARFNLPGPDLTPDGLALTLRALASQRVAIVNTASASGAFVEALSAPNHIVVTATKSGHERNETVFAEHFVAAFVDAVADVDKDERVSLLEAFTYARESVARFYEREDRLLTEHAVLDDDGDGVASDASGGNEGDGALARRTFLGATSVELIEASSGSRAAQLERERLDIEERIEALKAMKGAMLEDDYFERLEALLLELARMNETLGAGEEK